MTHFLIYKFYCLATGIMVDLRGGYMVVFLVGLRPVAWNYFYRAKFLGPISVYFAVGLVGYS